MNPILNDPLVQKYFGCKRGFDECDHDYPWEQHVALRVLDAICVPLNAGDSYLALNGDGSATQYRATSKDWSPCHPYAICLPSKHQEPDYEKELEKRRSNVFVASTVKFVDEIIDLARKAERQKMEREARR